MVSEQDGTINYAVLGNMLTATMLREVSGVFRCSVV